jgi:hypothetical protein
LWSDRRPGWWPDSGGMIGGRGGALAGGRGGGPASGSDPALAPSKGKDKQVWVVLDDDEVLFDDDAPLQKRLRLSSDTGGSSGSGLAAPEVVAATKAVVDREAADKRVVREAAVKEAVDKEAADKRSTEEATVKEVIDKEVADKRVTEEDAVNEALVGAVGDSSAPDQVPS